jgi:catechol 2,3-dioxygenase-like lactoylglutathione lyase family enzyme
MRDPRARDGHRPRVYPARPDRRWPFTPLRTGLDHLSFAVADDAALNAWSRYLDEIGIAHDPIDDGDAVVSMTLKDPDGIALEFYLLRPR